VLVQSTNVCSEINLPPFYLGLLWYVIAEIRASQGLLTDRITNKSEEGNFIIAHAPTREPVPLSFQLKTIILRGRAGCRMIYNQRGALVIVI